MRIESAVTTCDRIGVSYLEDTLKSLQDAGFAPQIVRDDEHHGSYWSLRTALERLLETQAEALAVFQDDILCAKGCREWLEGQLWPVPESEIGCLSLYTPSVSHLRKGWYGMHELPVFRPGGGCALCFTRHGAKAVLDRNDRAMTNGSDTTVACLFRSIGLSWMLHSPSLVEHIGLTSAIHPGEVKLDEWRTAGTWIDDARKLSAG